MSERNIEPVRFEFDDQADALYISIRHGRVARTIELDEGVYADLDAGDRPLGLEFIALAAFDEWMRRHGTLNVPERVTGRESFLSRAKEKTRRTARYEAGRSGGNHLKG